MTHKVGVKGQVVIPKAIRDRIGIRPGDEVAFDSDGEGAGPDALLAERRKERELEERKAEGRGVGRL
jgi:AbrB family looped-hinge helix DNA binding protein